LRPEAAQRAYRGASAQPPPSSFPAKEVIQFCLFAVILSAAKVWSSNSDNGRRRALARVLDPPDAWTKFFASASYFSWRKKVTKEHAPEFAPSAQKQKRAGPVPCASRSWRRPRQAVPGLSWTLRSCLPSPRRDTRAAHAPRAVMLGRKQRGGKSKVSKSAKQRQKPKQQSKAVCGGFFTELLAFQTASKCVGTSLAHSHACQQKPMAHMARGEKRAFCPRLPGSIERPRLRDG